MNFYTLFEVNEYIRRVISLNFEDSIWISCEINQINEVRGNYYIDLVQKEDNSDEIIAQAKANIWFKKALFISKKLGDLKSAVLQAGVEVKIKVNIDFNERYGLSFIIQDIDPSYTFGQLAIKKEAIIQRLKDDGFWQLNKNKTIPTVLKNIAVISSSTAAGFKDFKEQLKQNPYQYTFNCVLFQSSMQGQKTEQDVCQALKNIEENNQEFDLIVIIRGGGSKLDLSFFDNYNIAAHIGKSTIPVLVGIGHEIDQSITDLVSHTSVKTPTAAAQFIIEQNLHFESKIIDLYRAIKNEAKLYASNKREEINYNKVILNNIVQKRIQVLTLKLEHNLTNLKLNTQQIFAKYASNIILMEQIKTQSDPEKMLKKGFSIIRQEGKIITKKEELSASEIEIEISDSILNATIL